jgi:hypothetical protein
MSGLFWPTGTHRWPHGYPDMPRLRPRRRDNTAEQRPQKITLGEMRSTGLRKLLVYRGDYKCAHSVTISADKWSDDVRLSDLEPVFTCQACGHRGVDVRPLFDTRGPSRQGDS